MTALAIGGALTLSLHRSVNIDFIYPGKKILKKKKSKIMTDHVWHYGVDYTVIYFKVYHVQT